MANALTRAARAIGARLKSVGLTLIRPWDPSADERRHAVVMAELTTIGRRLTSLTTQGNIMTDQVERLTSIISQLEQKVEENGGTLKSLAEERS